MKVGFEPIPNSGIFIFGLGRATWGTEAVIAQSNVTGWYYKQSESSEVYGLFGRELGYFPKDNNFSAFVQYDNRMGVSLNLGLAW